MRIAIPLADNKLAEDFGDAATFTLYDIDDETRAVRHAGRAELTESGCFVAPAKLREQGVEIVVAHGISQNGVNNLLALGILTLRDVAVMPPDAIVAHLVTGSLKATPPEAAIHNAPVGGCGNGCGCKSKA